MEVWGTEGHRTGPAFGHRDGSAATIEEYDNILIGFLRRIQSERPDLISPSDPVEEENYSLLQTFCCTTEGESNQNAMKRWWSITLTLTNIR